MIELMERAIGTSGGGRARAAPTVTRVMDGITDGLVVLFALWTLIYHLALPLDPPTSALLVLWPVTALAVALAYARRRGWWAMGPLWDEPAVRGTGDPPRALPVVAVAAGLVAGACAGLRPSGAPWWCVWAAGLVSVAASGAWLLIRLRREPALEETAERGGAGEGAGEGPGVRWGTPLALLTGAGFAVASLFIVNTDGDDAYFVSRSVATAASGRIPLRDVIFTAGETRPIAGEPPVSSIEVLVGALARVLHVPAPSLLWYAVLPAVTFVAVWSLWRLVRAWAPRRAAACFAVAAVYLLWAGEGRASLGSFHLLRMWQGKAVLVSVLIPLLYVYLTRWAERRRRGDLALLAVSGIAAVGLTSSAAFVFPLATAATVVPLLAAGRWRTGLAACAVMAYPIASGTAVMLLHSDTAVRGAVHDGPVTYQWVLLQSTLGVLAGCALWLSPWTARRGVPALIGAGVAALVTIVLLPGVLTAAADVSGAGQVLWRTMWVVPAPALIGLLAAAPVPAAPRAGPVRLAAAAAPAAALAAALVAGGMPVWSETSGSFVASRPSWKLPADQVGTAREVVRAAGPGGVVLMPTPFMRAVPMLSADVHAVNPNPHYLAMLPAPARFIEDRRLLSSAVRSPYGPKPEPRRVAGALRRTGVQVACALPRDRRAQSLLSRAGYRDPRRLGQLVCAFPPRN
ncbi:hypothetical protein AGRA3207_007809 [Actinomadura graeca]|uniref:Uncharacterized protein n=1 Tax=Actinomadura graeca TaxID=2750812 RepID=A0ABX8R530_9ACTN|nr:DUF6077 domain-containing protein [Actinomadura graeca]QXJ26190.1 hypothetical protein AGRA3207_007809 [Actinomadura graeca]